MELTLQDMETVEAAAEAASEGETIECRLAGSSQDMLDCLMEMVGDSIVGLPDDINQGNSEADVLED